MTTDKTTTPRTAKLSTTERTLILDALKKTYQPVTALEVGNLIYENTGKRYSYEHVRRALSMMHKMRIIQARTETDAEREVRLGKNVRGQKATLFYYGSLPMVERTIATITDGPFAYRKRKTAGKKNKRKAQARKARTKTVTAASTTTTTIDDMIKELRELAEWKRRALTAEANLEKIRNIAGR